MDTDQNLQHLNYRFEIKSVEFSEMHKERYQLLSDAVIIHDNIEQYTIRCS